MRRGSSGRCIGSLAVLATCGLLLAGGAACPVPWPQVIDGDGHATTEAREVGAGFDAVETGGSMDVQVTVGPAPSVRITIDRNLQPYVLARVQGSRLILEQRGSLRPRVRALAEVTMPALRAVSTSGSGGATVDGGSAGTLSISTSGSGSVRWRGQAELVTVSTSGSGRVVLAGRAGTLQVSTSGSGDVDGAGLTVSGDAEVSTSGSARVEVALAGGALRARTSGSGDVLYSGEARVVDAQTSGSGRVRRR